MNDYQQIKNLSEKIERLLASVEKNTGRFSTIDKDMLTNYVRELYELIVNINPQSTSVNTNLPESPVIKSPRVTNGEEIKLKEEKVEQKIIPNGVEINSSSKENPSKKTISEIYAEKKENGQSSVNDKFKKQGLEIADKLKQTPIKDLKSYIGLNKQFAFMSKLFNADEELYENSIAKLNSFKTYEQATTYIQTDLLPRLNWSDDEPLVAEFFTLVMRRYLN